jgi:hypothetical protein
MRYIVVALIPVLLFISGCGLNSQDPAKNAANFEIKIQRFDSAFFAMDTMQIKKSITKLLAQYPGFGIDFIQKVLMLKSINDTPNMKAFYRLHFPIYQAAQQVNAIKIAKPELESSFKRLHYYFPKYNLTHNIILFVGPFESFGNIVTVDALAVGLQMHLGANAKWYSDESIQTIYPTFLSKRYAPEYIAVNSVQNILSDIYIQPANTQNLMQHMIEAGKLQYIIYACFPNSPDSIKYGYTKEQYDNLKGQEANIWDYILHEKLTYSTNITDIDNFMQEGESSSIFSESIPSNVGKYIGYRMVESWMHQKQQKGISMEAMLATPADKIFATSSYAP